MIIKSMIRLWSNRQRCRSSFANPRDTLTPAWMAERLFARAQQPKQLYLVPNAGHNDLLEIGGEALVQVLQKFVGEER